MSREVSYREQTLDTPNPIARSHQQRARLSLDRVAGRCGRGRPCSTTVRRRRLPQHARRPPARPAAAGVRPRVRPRARRVHLRHDRVGARRLGGAVLLRDPSTLRRDRHVRGRGPPVLAPRGGVDLGPDRRPAPAEGGEPPCCSGGPRASWWPPRSPASRPRPDDIRVTHKGFDFRPVLPACTSSTPPAARSPLPWLNPVRPPDPGYRRPPRSPQRRSCRFPVRMPPDAGAPGGDRQPPGAVSRRPSPASA